MDLPCSLKVGNAVFCIDPSFRTALYIQALYSDIVLNEWEKLDLAIKKLIRPSIAQWFLRPKQKVDLLESYINTFIPGMANSKRHFTEKVLDFQQDAAYLYAGFFQAYGIDLLGKDKNLHWWTFLALLSALPNDTKIMQIVDIRTRKLPKPTKYNSEERAQLMRLKAEYGLVLTEEEKTQNRQRGFAKLALALEAMAKTNDKNIK